MPRPGARLGARLRPAPLWAVALLAVGLAGCAGQGPPADVVATFYPLQYFAQRVAGPSMQVDALVPAGTEPHDYEPTPQDLHAIVQAKALVVQGAGFEGWVRTAQEQAPATRLVVATDGIPLGAAVPGEDLALDPHTWLDPVLAQRMARNIEAGLAASFPDQAASMAANADLLVADLAALDDEFRAGLAQCEVRVIVTNHAAFSYLAARYGFEQVAITLDPDAQPDPQDVRRAIDAARTHNVTSIFFEDLVSPVVAETVAREAGAKTLLLSPIESLPEEVEAEGGDYFDAMRLDLRNLREGMRCT